ncbi:MAG: tRNA lysidine(34) synthetase TilS [Clostridia bacterium]|nr:tRNA lysidine(34) synthetase TilS [Clostridia bacterium]
MIEKVKKTIKTHNMLSCGDRVIVALSGGADSVGLLYILSELREELGIEIYAANLNHKIRGAEGDSDSEFVKELCKRLNIRLFYRECDVKKMTKNEKIGEEECGRRERYRLFNDAAAQLGGARIATAHHLDDNAETFLLHLVRGSGAKGLGGIPYVRGNVIRPLLDVKKSEIEEYLEGKTEWRTDATNFDVSYARNRIRHNILPEMREICDKAEENIVRAAGILRTDEEFLREIVDNCGAFVDGMIDAEKLKGLHESIRRRVIITALKEWGAEEIDFEKISAVEDVAFGRSGRRRSLGGLVIENEYGKVKPYIESEPKEFSRIVKKGENVTIEALGYAIKVKTVDKSEKMSDNNMTAVFDADLLGDFEIRTRKDGDFMRPKGMKGRKKLKELFIDIKLPRKLRESIVTVAKGGEILFVPGIRKSASFMPSTETERLAVISFEKRKDDEN